MFAQYSKGDADKLGSQSARIFREGVHCSKSDWGCYGTGQGFHFQVLAKHCPQFAVEACAIGLRNLRQHWGPINRREVTLKREADNLLREVQYLIYPQEV